MLAHFSVRFVIAVFGGAALGLLVALIGRGVFDTDWNVFAGMPWGIMAAAVTLSFSYAIGDGKKADEEKV